MPSALEQQLKALEAPAAEAPPMSALERRMRELEAPVQGQAQGPYVAPEPQGGLMEYPRRAGQRIMGTDVAPGKSPELESGRYVASTAGAMMGATAGLQVPVAPGPLGIAVNPVTGAIFGGVAGGTLGLVAPELMTSVGEQLGLLPEGTTATYGRSQAELKRMLIGNASAEALLGVFAEMPRLALGRPFARAVTQPGSPMRREEMAALATGAKPMTGQELAEQAQEKFGITLMPWQVGRSPGARAILAVAGRFPWVGAPARKDVFARRLRFTQGGQLASEESALRAIHETPIKVGEVKELPELSDAIMGDAKDLLGHFQDYFKREYDSLWNAADAVGIKVNLKQTRAKVGDILATMRLDAPKSRGVPQFGTTRQVLVDFLENKIEILDPVQSLRNLDVLLQEIDDFGRRLEPDQFSYLRNELSDLRNAMLTDFTESLVPFQAPPGLAPGMPTTTRVTPGFESQAGRMPQGEGPTLGGVKTGPGSYSAVSPEMIAHAIRRVDEEYSTIFSTIFETSTAKKFGRVERRGLRGGVWDPATSTSIGKLAKSLIDLEEPTAIDELFRLIRPETKKDIAASMLHQGMEQAWEEASGAMGETTLKFNTGKFNIFFGLTGPSSARQVGIRKMLEGAGVALTMDDVKLLGRALDSIATSALPSASSFIARRAQIGGSKAVIAGLTGGLVGSTGSNFMGASATHSMVATGLGAAISFGLVRGIIRAMTNPAGAQSFRNAMRAEAGLGVTRANVMRLIRLAWDEERTLLRDANAMDARKMGEFQKMYNAFEAGMNDELKAAEQIAGRKGLTAEGRPPLR